MHPNKIINEDLQNIVASGLDWKQFENTTILITGANGFLPAYMVETLLFLVHTKVVQDLKVLALVRNKEKAEKRFAHLLNDMHLQFIVQDVCLPVQVNEPIHFIVHAASQASPKYYGVDPVGTLKANVIGTINLCELARKNPLKSLLYFSSTDVYGKLNNDATAVSETDYGYVDPLNLRSCYSEAKRMGETICISYMHQFGISVKVVRPAHIYGPGMDLNDGRVFADFVRNVVNNENIVLNSDGSDSRTFCYLSDATIAFFKVLLNGQAGEAYNVANPSCEITILELARKLITLFFERNLAIACKKREKNNHYMPNPIYQRSISTSKINKLEWIPNINIENGFKRTILSYL
ncbi:MAG: NAD-dependent epimerase/dehydratase family protein [Prevotellaceae bacterium]|nr:NAD-dependent epimerase/dehydratase family protein [Prevotellaceae bacterium]